MKTRDKKNIILCGFMGSGKTTVGSALAELLGRRFIDLDKYIERKKGLSIPEIFEKKGEGYFRSLETKYSKRLSRRKNLVISLGGGTVLNPENTNALKKSGLLIYLKVDCDTVLKRLKNDSSRPLLNGDKELSVKTLLTEREPIYLSAADFTVSGAKEKSETVNEILNIIF